MKQKKLMFNFFVNRNWSKLTDTRKRAKILADNRKSHHPIETLLLGLIFAGYVPLASQGLYPIIVYFLANCRPHISHFGANM